MRHANIAIFVPHLGCPHQCAFCNQKHITGCSEQPTSASVYDAVNTALSYGIDVKNTEIAFFGGSFTAIDRDYMIELLDAAFDCVNKHNLRGIRISTRPDCINSEVLDILKSRKVVAIELGAQSMKDNVLLFNERGHTANDIVTASNLIKDYGFELGLQMMTGLYKSSVDDDIFTAQEFIKIRPDTVRIYPTIVVKNTRLEELYLGGDYVPADVNSSVQLCVKLLNMFENASIKVIRLGLHALEKDTYVAGPWHPSFRELCDSYRFKEYIKKHTSCGKNYIINVNPSDVSKVIGQNRENLNYFHDIDIILKIQQDKSITKNSIVIEEVK